MKIIPLASTRPIVSEGYQTQEMRDWTQRITNMAMITGSGSPEGVVEANEGALYTDLDAATGARLYSKNGIGDTGWILA